MSPAPPTESHMQMLMLEHACMCPCRCIEHVSLNAPTCLRTSRRVARAVHTHPGPKRSIPVRSRARKHPNQHTSATPTGERHRRAPVAKRTLLLFEKY
eukprot:scaffold10819_cov108-Isochrysis_galbana.AAC.4